MKPALAGGLVWLGLCLVPLDPNIGIGLIEKLFLFAPMVIVPLGLALARPQNLLERFVGYLQPAGGMLVVASFFAPRGNLAAALVCPWAILTGVAALAGLVRIWQGAFRRVDELCIAVALMMLPVGGVGLVQSRLGLSPLGYREPVVLLVAVHFHYAAFVSPLLAGAAIRRVKCEGGRAKQLIPVVAAGAIAGSPILAAGYVLFMPWIRFVGATLLVVGLFALSLLTLMNLRTVRPRLAQVLLAISAGSVLVAMIYAAVYALADFHGEVWVAIPQMARTHGVINALGFSLSGLLGWTLASGYLERHDEGRALQSLTRRWALC